MDKVTIIVGILLILIVLILAYKFYLKYKENQALISGKQGEQMLGSPTMFNK